LPVRAAASISSTNLHVASRTPSESSAPCSAAESASS
jgi:hypothetical protein